MCALKIKFKKYYYVQIKGKYLNCIAYFEALSEYNLNDGMQCVLSDENQF